MAIRLYREIQKELKIIYPQHKVTELPIAIYIRNQFKRHNVTSQKECKSTVEMEHLGFAYLCLLRSSRKTQELLGLYRGHGERSVESSAELVGLKLPPQPD